MAKVITVSHEVDSQISKILLSYDIELDDNIQTISCTICSGSFHVPKWLQLRKFQLRSLISDNHYTPLFTDEPQVRTLRAISFIDKAYQEIMETEHFELMNYNN